MSKTGVTPGWFKKKIDEPTPALATHVKADLDDGCVTCADTTQNYCTIWAGIRRRAVFFSKKISKRIQLSGLKHAELKITAATDFDEHLLAVAAFPKGNGSVQHNCNKNIKILRLKTNGGNSQTLVK